jgi:hypothetical protein
VTAAKIPTGIALRGADVTIDSKLVVVSNTNAATQLAMVRGYVGSGGTVESGEGYSVTLGATGIYTVTFTTTLADVPSVQITPDSLFLICVPSSVSGSSFNVTCRTAAGVNTGTFFHFLAIGRR